MTETLLFSLKVLEYKYIKIFPCWQMPLSFPWYSPFEYLQKRPARPAEQYHWRQNA